MDESNKVVVYDYMILCVEVVFEDSEVPYDTYKVGSVDGLKEVLSEEFLLAETQKNNASRAFVKNIYCRASTEDRNNRLEFRVGNLKDLDLEAHTFEGDIKK